MELEEAIEILKRVILVNNFESYSSEGIIIEAMEVVLSHLIKQEKMIELMLEYLNFYGVEDDICTAELSKDCNENCKECIKQYFEKKVEGTNNE